MRSTFASLRASIVAASFAFVAASPADERPNILLIGIDDLNDWVGCLGGHPQALTPNLDRLAERGTLFTNAHCQAPVCNPSRASMMTSLYPETSGIYFLNPDIAASPVASEVKPLPVRFREEGYRVHGVGKMFHNAENARYFPDYGGSFGGFGPTPDKKISQPHGHPLWDWGRFPETDAQMPDYKIARWAVDELQKLDSESPFLLAVGFYRPHVPMFVPEKWFNRHPLDEIILPKVRTDDLSDLSDYAINITRLKHVAPTHEWVEESGEWKHAVQSYLASISFVDSCVGTVLDALDESPHQDNTIIVLFSDHGFHLGEKERWAKRSLWEDSTRVPMIVVDPRRKGGTATNAPVGLIDIFPTLLSLSDLKPDALHEGRSLVPLLDDPNASWPHFARTSFGPGNVTLRSKTHRYIRYVDGSEELYDHRKDPHEWDNLAGLPESTVIKQEFEKQFPTEFADVLGSGSTGHDSFSASARKLRDAP